MASPMGAGVIALLLSHATSRGEALTPAEVLARLAATALDAGAPGKDDEYGWGLVSPDKLLDYAAPTDPPADPPGSAVRVGDYLVRQIEGGELGVKAV
jgi:hypothetical protein